MVLHTRLPSSFKSKKNNAGPRAPAALICLAGGDSPATGSGRDLETDNDVGVGLGVQVAAGGVCDPGGAGTRLLAADAWMVVLRALSLGARSAEQPVATHALQLLTKVRLP